MTGAELKAHRRALGLSLHDLADLLRLSDGGAAHLRAMERDARTISGPIAVAVEAFRAGFRPCSHQRMSTGAGSTACMICDDPNEAPLTVTAFPPLEIAEPHRCTVPDCNGDPCPGLDD